jgi:ABC-type antimicrobial peptide transport system permease subunit
VRRAVQSAAAGVVVFNMVPVEQLVRQQTSRSRFTTWLLGVFAAAALVLAVVGLYGMMSYTVDQRSREFGIRVALGASRAMVVRLVLGDGARMIAIGLVIGTAAAWQMSRAISAELFEVTPYDSAAGLAIAGLAVTALLACAVPALRATRVDPARSLRNE